MKAAPNLINKTALSTTCFFTCLFSYALIVVGVSRLLTKSRSR